MKRTKVLLAAGAAASLVAIGTGGALAYGGPAPWAPGSGAQVTQQERQQQMIELHEQLGVPAGQPLQLHDGTGPHGPMGDGTGGAGTGPADCPYRTSS